MSHYYTLSEKRDFIDQDFKQSKLYKMDPLPEDPGDYKLYFKFCVQYGQEFMDKYAGKGWSQDYATEIVNDWIQNIERIMYERTGWGKKT